MVPPTTRAWLGAAIAVFLGAGGEAAGETTAEWLPPAVERSGRVQVGSRTTVARGSLGARGLERGLHKGGAYARAVRLDVEGLPADALREYRAAWLEVDGLSQVASGSAECRRAWRAKIAWQRDQSDKLLEQEAYVAVMPTSVLAHYNLASAYHAKYLAARAFLGHGPRVLWQKARAEYEAALALEGRHGLARAGLAGLMAAAGMSREARAQLALLGRRRGDAALAMALAACHAALGEADAALAYLAVAVTRPERRRVAAHGNDFDGLRDDPRFRALVEVPADGPPLRGCAR